MKTSIAVLVVFLCCSLGFTSVMPGIVNGSVRAESSGDDAGFNALIARILVGSHISCLSAAIVQNGSVVWSHGYGLADRNQGVEATPASIYLVASISKTMTATAVMQLYEQGKLGLDDDISPYLGFTVRNPQYPSVPITFRMLLSHHSSLATDPDTDFTRTFPADLQISGGYPDPFYQELLVPNGLHYIPQIWTTDAPGSQMHYANLGYGLLGYLVERITGEDFAAYCHTHIFQPLEMNDTSFTLQHLNQSRLVRPYEFISGSYMPFMQYTLMDYPAGGLRTTVKDLAHFLWAQMNQGKYKDAQLLSPATIAMMHTEQYPNHTGYDFSYGLGFQIWNDSSGVTIGHSGGLFGVATMMQYTLGKNTGVVMFCNKQIVTTLDRMEFSLLLYLLNTKAAQFQGLRSDATFPTAYHTTQLTASDFS